MQIKRLHKSIYKLSRYASKHLYDKKADPKYLEPVALWDQLKSQGVSDAGCAAIIGISRATYFRYKSHVRQNRPAKKPRNINTRCWGESEKQRVLQVRRANPTYGKAKIQVILKRDFGLFISESTVGRILRYLADNRLITAYQPLKPSVNGCLKAMRSPGPIKIIGRFNLGSAFKLTT